MAIALGADSVGVASVEAYSAIVPNGQKPDFLAEGMKSIVVLTKHLLTGCLAVEDVATQSTNSHLSLDLVDETLYNLAEWLEDRGQAALPISPEYADMDLVWSGGGLLDLKWTAEFAGLGHVGLNLNFLTPDYGSRVYLAALITDAELEPDTQARPRPLPRARVRALRRALPAQGDPDGGAARADRSTTTARSTRTAARRPRCGSRSARSTRCCAS